MPSSGHASPNLRHAPPVIPLRLWLIAVVTGSGAFMAMLDSTVANLALQAIRADLGASLADVQWVATGYLIALAVSLPLTGWLGHRFGQSRLWCASLTVFIVASAVCAVSGTLPLLIVSRCVQGLAAGLMVTTGQALLAASADDRQLGRLMGTIGFAVALGPALGPGLGGVLLGATSWHWLFWINVPVGAVALVAASYLLPPAPKIPHRRLDGRGLALVCLGLPLLLYGAAQTGSAGPSAVPITTAGVGTCLIVLFLAHARRTHEPLIELGLLWRPTFAAGAATVTLTGAAMYGGLLLLPLFLQNALGLSPGETGIMLLVTGLGSALALPVAGVLADRFGAGPVCFVGGGLLLFGTAPFFWPPALSIAAVAALLAVRGAGLALAQMPAMTAAYGAVEGDRTGDAATLLNIGQRVGGALGAVALVIVLEQSATSTGKTEYWWAFALLIAFAAGVLLTARPLLRHRGRTAGAPHRAR